MDSSAAQEPTSLLVIFARRQTFDMLRSVELARASAYYACWACDAADAVERHRAATMAQAFAADSLYEGGTSAALRLPTFISNHDAGRFASFLRQARPDASKARVLEREVPTPLPGRHVSGRVVGPSAVDFGAASCAAEPARRAIVGGHG